MENTTKLVQDIPIFKTRQTSVTVWKNGDLIMRGIVTKKFKNSVRLFGMVKQTMEETHKLFFNGRGYTFTWE